MCYWPVLGCLGVQCGDTARVTGQYWGVWGCSVETQRVLLASTGVSGGAVWGHSMCYWPVLGCLEVQCGDTACVTGQYWGVWGCSVGTQHVLLASTGVSGGAVWRHSMCYWPVLGCLGVQCGDTACVTGQYWGVWGCSVGTQHVLLASTGVSGGAVWGPSMCYWPVLGCLGVHCGNTACGTGQYWGVWGCSVETQRVLLASTGVSGGAVWKHSVCYWPVLGYLGVQCGDTACVTGQYWGVWGCSVGTQHVLLASTGVSGGAVWRHSMCYWPVLGCLGVLAVWRHRVCYWPVLGCLGVQCWDTACVTGQYWGVWKEQCGEHWLGYNVILVLSSSHRLHA